MTKLRGHSDLANSIRRTTGAFEIVYLDGTEPDDMATKEIAPLTDTDAALDADMDAYAAFLKRLLEENDDE